MIHLVTFSDESMSRARQLCASSALWHGCQKATEWTQESAVMLSNGSEAYIHLMTQPRGAGYWIWKPAIIRHELLSLNEGDILIYADAGVEFIGNANYIVDRMDQDVFLFGNNWEHAHWCKRDVVEAVYGESWLHGQLKEAFDDDFNSKLLWQRFGKQCQASVIFLRVSDYSRRFVAEWLQWCLFDGGRLIDDSPSILPNHPEFREHRHDQAILTTLAYREGVRLHWWPAVYNRGGSPEFVYEKLPEYAGDDYPILFSHHRRRDHEWEKVA